MPLGAVQPDTAAPVDLYIRHSNPVHYSLYKAAGTDLSDDTRQRLLANGIAYLYLLRSERAFYRAYAEEYLLAIIQDELLPAEDLWPLVYQTAAHVMKEILADPRAGENVARARRLSGSVVLSIVRNPERRSDLLALLAHDYHTNTHSVNVCVLMVIASQKLLGISQEARLKDIAEGAILHDIGKSEIPKEILRKPGELTPEELERVKEHPLLGLEIVGDQMQSNPEGLAIIRHHHERFDGSGYPDALRGEQIPLVAHLAGVVDVYDALTTNRPYARAQDMRSALTEMVYGMQGQFHVQVLRAFVTFFGPEQRMKQEASQLTDYSSWGN